MCSIIRNREKYLPVWLSQLNELIDINPQHNFYLSLYENDSTDNTKEVLKALDFSKFQDCSIISEDINTAYYGSVVDENRVKILALCRNKAIYSNNFLNICDSVVFVESDILYSPQEMSFILNNNDYDIISPRSLETHSPSPTCMYDTWGTRRFEQDEWWATHFCFGGGHPPIVDVWSTFNCFCKYNAAPIKNGISFGWFNERFHKFDCDTAVICENFRKHGFAKIGLDTRYNVYHNTIR
jgi:hypothetical protein